MTNAVYTVSPTPVTIVTPGSVILSGESDWKTRTFDDFESEYSFHSFNFKNNSEYRGGLVGTSIGTDNNTKALRFSSSGSRFAESQSYAVNSVAGDFRVSFNLGYGNGSNGGENVDNNEHVTLQYKYGTETYWTDLKKVTDDGRYGSHSISVVLSPTADRIGETVQFRWLQNSNSGARYDEWSLDNVKIEAQGDNVVFAPIAPVVPVVPGGQVIQGGPVNSSITDSGNSTSTVNNNVADSFNTSNTSTVTNNSTIDNSTNNTFTQTISLTVTGDNNTIGNTGTIDAMMDQVGGSAADTFKGNSSKSDADKFRGGAGNDSLTGFRGADLLVGDAGDDLLRGGNGRDILIGGQGSDVLYGGFGQNTFAGELDGDTDTLFLKSDQHAWNWIYQSTGNQNGNKVDLIGPLDSNDRIVVQGVSDSMLSFGNTTASVQGNSVNGIGIYASGTLEAIYTGDNLTSGQLNQMTTGMLV